MSTKHFNQLTPAEAERLALLAEECAEVIQIIGKIQRHGYASKHPAGGPDNRELLADELGHVCAAQDLMVERDDLKLYVIKDSQAHKMSGYRAKKYLHHQ